MLDDFSTVKIDSKKPLETPAAPAAGATGPAPEAGAKTEDPVNPKDTREVGTYYALPVLFKQSCWAPFADAFTAAIARDAGRI
jgi:hypothetical protein